MARGTSYSGATRLPEGIANVRAADRARTRARRRTATHYRQEYLVLLAEVRADAGTARTPKGHMYAAYREVCRRHPNTYRRYLAVERAKERIVPLPIGPPVIYPHGTEVAYKRHRKAPCAACQAWYDQHHRKPCLLCGRPFEWTGSQDYCGEDCKRMAAWLRYWRRKANNRKRRPTGPFEGTIVRAAAERAGLDLDEMAARWMRDPERSA